MTQSKTLYEWSDNLENELDRVLKREKITEEGVAITREGKRQIIPADTVVVAAGSIPEASLVGALRARGLEIYAIGDCASPGRIADALREAARVGREI